MSHYQQSYITLHYVTDKIYKAPPYWIGQDCQKMLVVSGRTLA